MWNFLFHDVNNGTIETHNTLNLFRLTTIWRFIMYPSSKHCQFQDKIQIIRYNLLFVAQQNTPIKFYDNKNAFQKDAYCPLFSETPTRQRTPRQRSPEQRPSWTKTLFTETPGQRLLWTEAPCTDNPWTETLPGQRNPPGQRTPPFEQNHRQV